LSTESHAAFCGSGGSSKSNTGLIGGPVCFWHLKAAGYLLRDANEDDALVRPIGEPGMAADPDLATRGQAIEKRPAVAPIDFISATPSL
jgi:hypothetical protein